MKRLYPPVLALMSLVSCALCLSAPAEEAAEIQRLDFPDDRAVGCLIDLDAPLAYYIDSSWWVCCLSISYKKVAEAKGNVVIPPDCRLGLVVDMDTCGDLSFLHNLSPDALELLAFESSGEPGVATRGVLADITRMTSIKALALDGLFVSTNDLVLLKDLPSLEMLRVRKVESQTATAVNIARVKSLKRLEFRVEGVLTPDMLDKLSALPALEELVLNGDGVASGAIAKLSKLPALTCLHINYYDFGDVEMSHLSECGSLRKIEFYDLTDFGMCCLPDIPTLKSLDIQGKHSGFSVEAFANLAKITGLNELVIHGCYTDDAIAQLTPLKSLKALGLHTLFQHSDYITDAALYTIAQLPSLESLIAYTGAFSDQGVRALTAAPHLKVLVMPNANILTDQALIYAAQIKTLERLHIRATNMTDAGLRSLSTLTSLESLDLFNPGEAITQAGKDALAAKLPGLRITIDEPNAGLEH